MGFVIFHAEYPETNLTIIGEGEEQTKLQELITKNNANNYISIIKPIEDLNTFSVKFDVLCLMSMWEGFPNVLAESLSQGIPALGFSNADGVSDLIIDDFNGWLTLDDGSPEAISNLLMRTQLSSDNVTSENCIQSIKGFTLKSIEAEWEKLLKMYKV
jgi:glycosyltransferase involved in cell wall biosynthesis